MVIFTSFIILALLVVVVVARRFASGGRRFHGPVGSSGRWRVVLACGSGGDEQGERGEEGGFQLAGPGPIAHHKTDMGQGMAVLRSKDPEGVAQEMWALFAVYQAIHTLIGAAVDAVGIPPEKISFPHALAAATDTVSAAFPPHDLDLAVATFLLKILDPGFFVRDRPDRASPRRTKKAGDFPARQQDEPSVVTVTRRIQLHSLRPRPSG